MPTTARSPSWHHVLRAQGHEVVSIGKLHFRGAPGDDHGFSEEIVPMHVIDATGDVKGLVRSDIPTRRGGDKMAKLAGPGRIAVHRLRPRDRVAGTGLAARGRAKAARQAVGALRVVRGSALPAHRAARVVLPLRAREPALAQAIRPGTAPASSLPRRLRARRGLRSRTSRPTATSAARSPATTASSARPTSTSATSCRRWTRRALPRARASSTRATTATTSARADCGESRPCTRNRQACP